MQGIGFDRPMRKTLVTRKLRTFLMTSVGIRLGEAGNLTQGEVKLDQDDEIANHRLPSYKRINFVLLLAGMAENSGEQVGSLRDSLNRWNETRSQNSKGFNESAKTLFSTWADSINSGAQDVYQRLPLTRQDLVQDQEPSWFNLSRTERLLLFVCFILGSIASFTICVFLFPVLAVNPRKFGLLWSMGSLLFVLAFGVLMGPTAYIKHLVSRERLPFTVFFFVTCVMTIYFAAISKSTLLTIPFAILELIAVLYYGISYFPMGATGLKMISTVGVNTARGALHI